MAKKITLRFILLALLLPGTAQYAYTQNAINAPAAGDSSGKTITIPHLASEPELDGVLDDAQWAQATLVDDFYQMNPVEYASPSQRTEVRVFYSEDALYVGARMYETDPSQITARILRQGQGLGPDDIFVLMLDPYLDGRSGYEFEINPHSIREEGIFKNVSVIDRSWLGIWQAKSLIDERGWTAEVRIPFQTISFNPDSDTWGINFRRAIRRSNETIGWVSRNRQMNPSIAGTVNGFEGLRQGLGLDVVPYLLVRQERIFGTPGGGTDNSIEPQLDMFYKITPQLNAALTINTDFSATEVDDRQVNLSRFSLFFPERRDFFTRDADIFEFGQIGNGGNAATPGAATQNGRPFFSRRIGLSPSGAPVDMDVGAKLSGRIGNWNLGSLVVRQGEDEVSGLDGRDVFVGRAALNVLGESQVGVVMTHGNPQADLDNTVMGADFNYRNSRLSGGRVVQAKTWYQQSDSENLSGKNAAYGAGISFPNNTGWQGGYNFKRIEANFNPALGFVNQVDMQDHALDFGYAYFLPRGNYIRSVYPSFDAYRSEDLATGELISENLGLKLWGENNTADSTSLRFIRNHELLQEDFTIFRSPDGHDRVVLPQGDYVFYDAVLDLNTGTQRALSGGITLQAGEYYDGDRFQRQMNLSWRPGLGYAFGMSYTENEIRLPHGHFTVRQTNLNSQISFSSTLTWSNRIQYDNVSELIGFNSRLHWIPEAGRQAFLVLNYGLIDPDRDNTFVSVNWDLSLKMNYTLRF